MKKINEQDLIKKLKAEGFKDVGVYPILPQDFGEHTHEEHTIHIILTGKLIVTDKKGTQKLNPGDRVEFPAGTTHRARGGAKKGSMIIGVKK
ncbi:cupin domain-containing protein [Candidatus Woesearchaeota archaeon]|nr:cupin domain-containing protein [Candidatus Woesearchaeota archaeon]